MTLVTASLRAVVAVNPYWKELRSERKSVEEERRNNSFSNLYFSNKRTRFITGVYREGAGLLCFALIEGFGIFQSLRIWLKVRV